MKRHLTSAWTGICPHCNNLQPSGHEDTLGRTPTSAGRWVTHEGRQPLTGIVTEPALFIPKIETKELLRAREIDPQTGRPFRDCRYCRLLCDVFDIFFIDEWMNWVTDTKNGMHLNVALMIRQGSPLVICCSGCFIHDPKVMHPRLDLEMFLDTPHELEVPGAPTMGTTLPRIMDTRDPRCMQFAWQCIHQCLNEHPACARTSTQFNPTRLLVLGPTDADVRLCDTPPAGVRWAALSHCWGGAKPLRLLASNMDELKKRIDLYALPSTFRDAIQVCRSLAIEYLWIDSLCIIQDSKLDWQQEAAQMGATYAEAFLVILGGSSASPDQPFLGPREEGTREDFWGVRTVDFETPSGVKLPIKIRRRHLLSAPMDYGEYDPPYSETWATLKRVGPLYKRSWCFQESYLASRALHFSPGALIFECKTHRRVDDTPKTYSLSPPPGLSNGDGVPDSTKWQMIVKSYTSRQLTFASDKLPAVSGIASLMPQASNDKYLAGLWRNNLIIDLLWQVMPSSSRTSTVMTYPPDEQSAPSWSWASLSQGVLWNQYNSFEPLASILEAECAVEGVNPYGAVNWGYVKLTGRILPCLVKQGHQHHAYYQKPDCSMSMEQWFMGDGLLVGRTFGEGETSTRLACRYSTSMATQDSSSNTFPAGAFFFCLGRTGVMHYNHVGLIVTMSEKQPGCMERIGNITNIPKDWYDNSQPMTITLI